MFEGILKAFKKRLEAPDEAEQEQQVESSVSPEESDEIDEFDILKYVETHGVVDKDSKTSKKKAHLQTPFKILKEKKENLPKEEPPSDDVFSDESQIDGHSQGVDEILEYVNRFGVYNKDSSVAPQKKKRGDASVYINKRAMEKRIDLHGMTVDEAENYVRRVIDEAKSVGITQLLIVHGRGLHSLGNGGVDILRQRVRSLLSREYSHLVESFKYASGAEGGDGATRVFLK